jgi:predicted nucleic acid-binding protein
LSGITRPARLYLIDTSARSRVHHPEIGRILARLVSDGAAATCVTADLEAGYSGRDHSEVVRIAANRRDRYRLLPINEEIGRRARQVQINMAARGHHRAAGVIDLLTAAVAEYYGAVILHYDADFEHIAAATGQPHMWVVPRGRI